MKTFWLVAAILPLSLGAAVEHLKIEGVRPASMKAGKAADVVVEMSITSGFHVQANPASRPQLIATKVDIAGSGGVDVGRPVYPKAKPYKIAGIDAFVDTYEGRFEVKVPLTAAASAAPGKLSLDGKVKYQACDDKVCFPPTVAKFTAPVEITR